MAAFPHAVRTILRASATGLACAGLLALVVPAAAEPKAPEGNVEITVGTSAGGTPDIIMRQLANAWNATGIVPNPIQVVNRTGGSWTVSSNFVLGQAGNNNLLYAIAQPVITTPIVQGTDNTFDKLTPIAMLVAGDLVVFGQPDAPEKTLADIVERAKGGERSVSVAGAQAGSTDNIVAAQIEKAGGVKLNYVPFDGGGAALAAFLGQNVDLIVLPPSEALDLMKDGKLKPLAILNEERRTEPEFADIPTAKEQGLDVVWGQAWGVAGPPGMDEDVAEWWSQKAAEVQKTEAWEKLVAENYWTTRYLPRAEAGAAVQKIYEDHLAALRDLGLAKQ